MDGRRGGSAGSRKPGHKNASGSSKPASAGARPSNAILEAKRAALAKKRISSEVETCVILDPLQAARDSKDSKRSQTGVVYDMRMVEHRSPWDPNHPERPERFTCIMQRCLELGLLERCVSVPPRYAKPQELLSVHTVEHMFVLRELCDRNGDNLEKMEDFAKNYDAIYFHRTTNELALLSCGSTIDLVKSVVMGKIQNGMAIVRPPGHHAMKDEYCGYCYFNNVAIAAKQVLESGAAKRVLIVDFDVHHGQATQQMFYDDPRVLYFSTHRFENGMYWPNLEESNYNWIGTEKGTGYNCNIPLNKTGMGNTEFLTTWHKVLLPMAYKFNPDLVIVSAGFDAALGCPEGEMKVTPQCYPHLIWPLMGLANGKLAVVLEGGYCLKSLAEGAALTLRALLGDPCPLISPISTPDEEICSTILNATSMFQKHWQLGYSKFLDHEDFKRGGAWDVHLPTCRFDWTTPKPLTYPTRDCHPVQSLNLMLVLDEQLNMLSQSTSLAVAKHRVGLIYDAVMLGHRASDPGHPETPERISAIFACHVDFGLVERCFRIEPRKAIKAELDYLHSDDHIRIMEKVQSLNDDDLADIQDAWDSVYLNRQSYEAALYAAGSTIQAVDSVMSGECQSVVAIVRPPGHHAEITEPCGFCIFNNVAVAAHHAVATHKLKRVLIVDWDVHHGNGIQHMFEFDPRVLYISLHRYDGGSFFPGKEDANYDVVGHRRGQGFNVNIPWNGHRMGDTEYLAAFTNIVLPIAYEYAPELVLVSAGFDAAVSDLLGGYKVTPEGYAHMTNLLSPLANGRIILALEGGYNLTSLSYSMTLCTKALLGDPIPPLTINDSIAESAMETIRNVVEVHSNYWTVLKPFKKDLPEAITVPLGNYGGQERRDGSADDISKLMEKMGVREPKPSVSDSVNGNEPICAGGPAAPLEGDFSPNNNRPNTANRQVNSEAAFTEMSVGSSKIPAASQAEPEGAVGGSAKSKTKEEFYSVMVSPGQDPSEDTPQMFVVNQLPWCPHLKENNAVPRGVMDLYAPCGDCGNIGENWICLTCYSVFCSRYVQGHMQEHSVETSHPMALSLSDLSVWCFPCDDYVDSPPLQEAKAWAYLSKFGPPIPGTAGGEVGPSFEE